VLRIAPVLLPFLFLVGTGLLGRDFGLHWDERPWQIGPTRHMVASGTPFPGYYDYPSFDYWVNLAVLSPDVVTPREPGEGLRAHLVRVLDSERYLFRLRAVYLTITSLTVVWLYLLVLQGGGSWGEALLASCILGGSWEVAYHLRWVASDGMLMQSATLTLLCALRAFHTRRPSWLIAAAAMAGVGFGTKYPGGLLWLPVALAGIFSLTGRSLRAKATMLIKITAVFAVVFVVLTPAVVFKPDEVGRAVLYEIRHYATGHGGHTVHRGLEHAGRMLAYFSSVFLSSNIVVALFLFALAVVGMGNQFARDVRKGAVLLVFPLVYLLYFSTQGTMVVRNLLVVAPFVALCAARGAGAIGTFLGQRTASWGWPRTRANHVGTAWVVLLGAAVLFNAAWLLSSAESIVARGTDRFVHEAVEHVRTRPGSRYLLSPRVKLAVGQVAAPLSNLTDTPADADAFVLYAREGMQRWHDWPASRRGLTTAWFGPREVNFDIYPNWWGDDRIVVIDKRRAREFGLSIAGIAEDATPPAEPASLERVLASANADPQIPAGQLPSSWGLPAVDPRILAPRALVQSIVGPIARGPVSGGWDLDGRSCTLLGEDGTVVSLTVISTSAFGLERQHASSVAASGSGLSAYFGPSVLPSDVRLFSRSVQSAVIVHVTGGTSELKEFRRDQATRLAGIALARLDAAQAAAERQ
jgi:hypothetical protein